MSILFTLFQVSQILASTPQSWALEVYKKTVAARDAPENQNTQSCNENSGWSDFPPIPAPRTQPPSANALFPSASCLPALSFSLMPSNIPVCRQEQRLYCQFKEAQLQRKEMASAPTPLQVPGTICRSSSQAGEKRPLRVIPLNITVGLIRFSVQLLPPSVQAAFSRRLGRETHAVFHPNSKTVRFFTPAQEPVQVVIQRSIMG